MLRTVIGRMTSYGLGRLGVHVRVGGGTLRTAAPARCCHGSHHRQQVVGVSGGGKGVMVSLASCSSRAARGGGGVSLLPPTVVQLSVGGLAGRGGRLQHIRAYGRGGDDWEDDYWDDDDEEDDDEGWHADGEEEEVTRKAEKDLATLRGLQGPRVADTLPMPEPGEKTDPPRKLTKEDVAVTFARSGGAGGQNVNKVNTKVDMRLHLENAADWLHPWAGSLVILEKNRVNKDGELVIQSSRYRTQAQNLDDALEKMQACINRASKLPQHKSNKAKVKKLAKQANKANNIRLDKKKRGSEKKKLRNNKNIDFD